MTKQELFEQIIAKKSYLCVGLDTDINRIPKHLLAFDDPIFEFNKQILLHVNVEKVSLYELNNPI